MFTYLYVHVKPWTCIHILFIFSHTLNPRQYPWDPLLLTCRCRGKAIFIGWLPCITRKTDKQDADGKRGMILGSWKKRGVRGPPSSVLDTRMRTTTLKGEWSHTRGLELPWKFQLFKQEDGVYIGEPDPVIFVLSCPSYLVHITFVCTCIMKDILSLHDTCWCVADSLKMTEGHLVSPAISQVLNLTNQKSRGYILRWDIWSARLCLSQRG